MRLAAQNQLGRLAQARYLAGSEAWTPESLGAKLLLAYDTFDASRRTLNGGDISALSSYGAVSDSLTQSTAAKQPLLSTGQWNSKDIAVFDRSAAQILDVGNIPELDDPASLGIFVVFRPDTWAGSATYFASCFAAPGGSAVRLETAWNTETELLMQIGAGGATTNKTTTIAAGTVYAIYFQVDASGNRRAWVDGTEVGTVTGGASPGTSRLSGIGLGGRFNDTFHSDMSSAHMSITTALSESEISDYFAWAATEF